MVLYDLEVTFLDDDRHAKTPVDERLVGPLGLEPRTKGFT